MMSPGTMTLVELQKLAAESKGEWEHLEFTKTTGELHGGMERLCALLNGSGCLPALGVTPSGRILGHDVTNPLLRPEVESKSRPSNPGECLGRTFPDDEAGRGTILDQLRVHLVDRDLHQSEEFPVREGESLMSRAFGVRSLLPEHDETNHFGIAAPARQGRERRRTDRQRWIWGVALPGYPGGGKAKKGACDD